MTRILTSAALAILFVVPVAAQKRKATQKPQPPPVEEKKPSLKETQDFLKEKILANAFYKYSSGPSSDGELVSTDRVEDVQFEGCVLTLKMVNTKVFSLDPIVDTTTFVDKVEMSELDAKQVVVEDNGSNFAVALNTNRKPENCSLPLGRNGPRYVYRQAQEQR